MHHDLFNLGVMVFIILLDSTTDRSGFDELGPGPYDGDDFHGLFHILGLRYFIDPFRRQFFAFEVAGTQ
ncbi:MAG: hypothetical protein AMK69_25005 [Nitrospira bacterium SG8_3]|nr:MAG: hypothetical protein AMK69_25005 [Nitrospira bacterium SG8_3]